MSRDEQILSEAKKYYSDSINCHNAFLHGVEWADKYPVNVWHDKNEEPIYFYCILCTPWSRIPYARLYCYSFI